MRKRIKRFISFFLVPLTRWYLRKERKYSYKDTSVIVLPGVFHPGLFYSTKFLLDYLLEQPISNKSLLELGCGTGLIAVMAAKSGANVTASDLSLLAIENVTRNAQRNRVLFKIIHSDLFDNVEKKPFDWIIINPPYYAKAHKTEAELAWHCGENFEYFHKLFTSLKDYLHAATEVIMVLTKGSEIETIRGIGNNYGFEFELVREQKVFFDEKDFLYRIKRVS
jgi:release factor glutamine methyltransferase